MFKVLLGALTLAYPFIVYYAMDHIQPRYLAMFLAGLFLLRSAGQGADGWTAGNLAVLMPASGLFMLVIGLANDAFLLMVYPVFANVVLFGVFFYSVLHPPSVVERLVRLREPDLPPQAVGYIRKVTLAWCAFFMGNGLLAAVTVWHGDPWVWGVYNGCIAYVLMGLLMGAEMIVRKTFKKKLLASHARN
jgi:uncharacterized membrane protein